MDAPIIGGVRIAVAALLACLPLAGCGGGPAPAWSGVRGVTVTVAQPGLPPPFGRPRTTAFTTPAEIAQVTAALNRNHIAQASSTSASNGCAGGTRIAIAIVPRVGSVKRLNAYRCANQTTGNVSGDLIGFLRSVGVRL